MNSYEPQQPPFQPQVPADQNSGNQMPGDQIPTDPWAAPPPQSSYFGPHPQPVQTRPGRSWRTVAAAGVAAVALSLGSGAAGAAIATNDLRAPIVSSAVTEAAVAAGATSTEQFAQVAAAVSPSVVSINVRGRTGGSEGSGVIIRSDGHILTNNHVVAPGANGGAVQVRLADGRTAPAEIVGRDPGSDLAVIKASGLDDVRPVALAPADSASVGDSVLAIGSPLGLDGSVTAGIVSALHRPVALGGERQFGGGGSSTLADAIQTDAAINPGNSGGALVDMSGRLIGINTAIATLGPGSGPGAGTSGSIGLGFAIPIAQASKVAEQLIRGETPTHAVLGVQMTDSPGINGAANGAVIGALTAGGAAADAGLEVGDVVTAVGDRRVSDSTDLAAAIRSQQPGDTVRLTVMRNGQELTLSATLGSASS